MPPFDAEEQRKMRAYDTPVYGYRLDEDGDVEAAIFDGELPDGWADSPAELDGTAPADDGEHVDPGRALELPYEDHRFNVLRAEFKVRTGKGPPTGTDTATLIGLLETLDVAEVE